MKKLISVTLAIVLTLGLSVSAFAAPASTNANYGPGVSQVQVEDSVSVRIGGNGNSARLIAYVNGTPVYVSANRPANNTVTTLRFEGFVVAVTVRGNSIIDVNVVSRPGTTTPAVPYIVSSVRERVFVDQVQVDSLFRGAREVAGSRNISGLVVSSTVREINFSHYNAAATGSGVAAGFTATGTLNFQFFRVYVERFNLIYDMVTITTWSDGTVVRAYDNAPFVDGTVNGNTYHTGPFAGSSSINESGGNLFLTRGDSDNGTGQGFLRSGQVSAGGFTVGLYLANQSPRVDVTSYIYNVNAFNITLPTV